MKLISVITPCYNEEGNIEEIYLRVKKVFSKIKKYRYEHLFIDNASTDNSVLILKKIARKDKNVKVIINARNFGWIRSQYYALMTAAGDGVVLLVADLQDPPEMIADFIKYWEKGFRAVVGIKKESEENIIPLYLKKAFYKLAAVISETELLENFTGFGLYDKTVIHSLRNMSDPYPYFRGLVSELGYPMQKIEYIQRRRKKGKTSADFLKLLDIGLLGITSYSRLPIRLITVSGMVLSFLSLIIAVFYVFLKIFLWSSYPLGTATLVIGLFFFSSVQMMFIGIIGEYIGLIHTRSVKRPLVIEKERINF